MTEQNSNFANIQRLLMLVIGLVFVSACTPSEPETPTPTTAVLTPVSTPTTLAAEPITTARPPSEPTATTPQATPAPTEDLLAWRTPDPFSITRTPIPSSTNTPFILPPTRTVEWPELNYDLLFIADGSLKRWNHETEELEVLIESAAVDYHPMTYPSSPGIISGIQVSSDGQTIIANRKVSNEPFTQEFIFLDLESGQSRIIVPPTPYLWRPSFSPDGRQIAYFVGEPEEFSFSEGPETGVVVIKNIYDDEPPIMVGRCTNEIVREYIDTKGCKRQRIVWSPDGTRISWGDSRGVLVYTLNTGITEIVQTHYIIEASDFGEVRAYTPIDWSPNGHYLRLEAGHYEGGSESVLDTETGILFNIPNTYRYDSLARPYVIWLADGRLFQLRTEGEHRQFTTYAEIWRPESNNGNWIIDNASTLPTSQDTVSSTPIELDDGSVVLAMFTLAEIDLTDGLYKSNAMDGDSLEFTQLLTIYRDWELAGIAWSPDASGVILVNPGEDGETVMEYVPVGDSEAYDLSLAVGYIVSFIYWLP